MLNGIRETAKRHRIVRKHENLAAELRFIFARGDNERSGDFCARCGSSVHFPVRSDTIKLYKLERGIQRPANFQLPFSSGRR